jgi:hypothetical protein
MELPGGNQLLITRSDIFAGLAGLNPTLLQHAILLEARIDLKIATKRRLVPVILNPLSDKVSGLHLDDAIEPWLAERDFSNDSHETFFLESAWETSGHLRRIGSSQDPFGRVSAVLLFLPPGHLGDYHGLFRELSLCQEATVLFPTARWFTAEIEALRSKNHLEFVDLADRLARIDSQPASAATPAPLPVITKPRDSAATRVRAVIHAGNGLTWSQVRIEIQGNQTHSLCIPSRPLRLCGSPSSPLKTQH